MDSTQSKEETSEIKDPVVVVVSEDSSSENNVPKVVFPPPSLWYKSSCAASRDDMWAYSGGGIIVLVKSPTNPVIELKNGDRNKGLNGLSEEEVTANEHEEQSISSDQKVPEGPPDNNSKWPSFTLLGPQQEKYNSVSFCQSSWDYLPVAGSPLVSGCEGGFVRVWNLEQKSAVIYHDNHAGQQVNGVDWSARDHSLIYSIDDAGTMTVWNVTKNTLRSMSFGKVIPTCLHVCPHEDNIVCFGTKGGNIFIVEVSGNGKILARVRHEEEVVVARWKPAGKWPGQTSLLNSNSEKFPILASSTHSIKLPTIRMWNKAGCDLGVLQVWERDSKSRPFKVFGPVAWVRDPNSGEIMVVSSGRHGEIVSWYNGDFEVIHRTHVHNAIFAMVQCGDILWTMSYEPVIVGWNLRTMALECVIPTFKGACTIAPSPVDATRLAIGGTDSVIRVLKCSAGYPAHGDGCIKPPLTSHKLKGKVTAIAWHPTKDNCIGFGTDEGVLGIYELKDDNKHATTFDRRVNGTVYTVTFGPSVAEEGYVRPAGSANKNEKTDEKAKHDSYLLYACGGSSIFMIYPSKSSNPLISVSKIIEKSNPNAQEDANCDIRPVFKSTDIRWTPDYSYLAVGYNDGRIEIYSAPNLKMKCRINCHLRAIQFLVWRPYDFYNSSDSPDRWLVSASNDGTTRLYNLRAIFETNFMANTSVEPLELISSQATFQGHGTRVISCAWSPHDKNLLVTVAYDCTAIVWNIADGSHIARYMEHKQRLVACCFHPIDRFRLITISDELSQDFSVHVWDYRDHPFRKNLPKLNKGCRPVAPIKAASENLASSTSMNGLPKEDSSSDRDVLVVKNHGEIHSSIKKISDASEDKPKSTKHKTKTRALLPITCNALINQKFSLSNELRFLVDKTPFNTKVVNGSIPNGDGDKKEVDEDLTLHLGLLGDSNDCLRQLRVEREGQESKSLDNAAILSKLMDDIEWFKQAIKNRQVTESMLPIIGSLSRQLYAEALVVFADKLADNEEYVKACTYYSIAGKVDTGIQVLVKNNLYREAIAVMKMTFPSNDPRITDVMTKWTGKAISDGNFELAAKLYCSMGQYSNALLVIEKRDFPYAFETGCFISSKLNDEKKLDLFGIKFVLDGIIKGTYKECRDLIQEYPSLKWLTFVVKVHECLTGYAKYVGSISDIKGLDMWKSLLTNLLDEVKEEMAQCNELAVEQKKISSNLLLSISQNDADAQQIISKNLTLLLMGISDEELAFTKVLESVKLAKTWFEEKNFPLYSAVILTLSMTISDLKLNPEAKVPMEIATYQSEVMSRLVKLISS